MVSRGPDGSGTWLSDQADVGLAHRRLAILDLSERAAQPMASRDGTVQVVFNGEIYNHPELRRWAEARGAVYRTTSDTETLLHLYELAGDDFVSRLRGMFAFALWDTRRHKLLLARDPFGIKPLYYSGNAQSLRFASQTRTLLAGGVDGARSPAGVASFFLWGYVTEPHTWYRHIHSLPAGSLMRWHPGSEPEIENYRDPLTPLREPEDAAHDAPSLRSALLESVEVHLLSDVPVGVFLSAGVDSGTLLSLAGERVDRRSIRAVTLAFDEYAGTPSDEAPVARAIAQLYEASHQVVTYSRGDFLHERAALLSAMDQPTIDGTNTYFVSRATAQAGLKVALSGLGGDEFVGRLPFLPPGACPHAPAQLGSRAVGPGKHVGYWSPSFRASHRPSTRACSNTAPTSAAHTCSAVHCSCRGNCRASWARKRPLKGWVSSTCCRLLKRVTTGIVAPHDQVMALELSVYLRNCLLRDADWAGMAHSLEIRTPLVDVELFAQLAALRRKMGGAAMEQARSCFGPDPTLAG